MTKAKDFVRDYALSCYYFDGEEESGEDYLVGRLINKHMKGKRILDLGCGPVVAITSVFYPNAEEVVAVDKLEENLDFVKNNSNELDVFVANARKYKRRYLSKRDTRPKISLIRGDIKNKLPIGKFDSVMQIGCFACVDTPYEFQKAVDNAYSYLKKGGILLMLNWFNDKREVRRPFHFNGPVNAAKLYKPVLEKSGFRIKEIHVARSILCKETKRLGYNGIVWAVAKK